MGECNLCISNTEFKSKKALTKHRRIKHTAKRADIQMWCCFFCHGLFKGYPRDPTFIFTNSRDVTPLLLFQQIFKQQLLKIYLRFLELETARLNDSWKRGLSRISPFRFY